jgi:ArsR family metal-binding transcriptional regulator
MAIKPCRADAFEVVPKRKIVLDLVECARMLEENGYEIVSNRGVMLVVRKGIEMTLYPHGRVLLHPVKTKEEARSTARELYTAIGR